MPQHSAGGEFPDKYSRPNNSNSGPSRASKKSGNELTPSSLRHSPAKPGGPECTELQEFGWRTRTRRAPRGEVCRRQSSASTEARREQKRVRVGMARVQFSKPLKDWLGCQDSNLGMAESKSAALPLGYIPPAREENRRPSDVGGTIVSRSRPGNGTRQCAHPFSRIVCGRASPLEPSDFKPRVLLHKEPPNSPDRSACGT